MMWSGNSFEVMYVPSSLLSTCDVTGRFTGYRFGAALARYDGWSVFPADVQISHLEQVLAIVFGKWQRVTQETLSTAERAKWVAEVDRIFIANLFPTI